MHFGLYFNDICCFKLDIRPFDIQKDITCRYDQGFVYCYHNSYAYIISVIQMLCSICT